METQELPFLVALPDEDEDSEVKGFFRSDSDIGRKGVPVDKLKQNLTHVCKGMASALQDVKDLGDFKLKEVTIQVEVTAEGGVDLVGTAKLGGKGAITLTFSQ